MASMLQLNPEKTTVEVFTYAKGLLAKLAHDLALSAGGASGQTSGESSAEIRFPVAGIKVEGSMKKGQRNAMSPSDCDEIERRLRDELGGAEVRVRAELGDSRATLDVETPRGRQRVDARVEVERSGEALRVRGKVQLSLSKLGVAEIKGPAGAFKLSDGIDVAFDASFAPD